MKLITAQEMAWATLGALCGTAGSAVLGGLATQTSHADAVVGATTFTLLFATVLLAYRYVSWLRAEVELAPTKAESPRRVERS